MAQNSTSQPPLSFTLTNKEGKSGIHIIDTPDEPNDLTLTITNNTQQPLSLKGGLPVRQSALPDDGPSTFYLYFNRLLQAAEVNLITLDEADTWQHQPFTGKYGRYLALVPKQDIILPAQTSMTLHNIHAAPQAQTSYVSIDYRNIGGLADATMQAKLFVFRLPSSKLLDEAHKLVQAGTEQVKTQLNQAITAAQQEAKADVQSAQATAQTAQTQAKKARDLAQYLVDTSPQNLGKSLKELSQKDDKLATTVAKQASLLKTVSTNQQSLADTQTQLAQINQTVIAAQTKINDVSSLLTTVDKRLLKPPILARFVKGNQVLLTAGGAAVNSASNELTLSLTNTQPAGQGMLQGAASDNPIFTLSFICGDQEGCLAPANDVSSISISIKEDYGNDWRVQKQTQGSNPTWQLHPQDRSQILGHNEQAFIEVALQNIPAVSEGITWLKIAYAHLAGYQDGYFVLPIVKVSPNEQGLTLVGQAGNASIYKHVGQGLKIKAHDDTQGIEFLKADDQTSQLVIKDGRVGIGGITSPGQTLSVFGRVRGGYDESEQDFTEIGHDGNNGFISTDGRGRLDFWNGGGSPLVSLLKNGNLGIGTKNPKAKLAIKGGEIQFTSDNQGVTFFGGGRIYKKSGDGLKIKAHNDTQGIEFLNADGRTSQLKIANGRVGIGTTSPAESLDVRGDIKFGTQGQDYPLAGLLKLRVIAGSVNLNGTKRWGSGFTCRKSMDTYHVFISDLIADRCAVTCSSNFEGGWDREDDMISFKKVNGQIMFVLTSTDGFGAHNVGGSFDFIVIMAT